MRFPKKLAMRKLGSTKVSLFKNNSSRLVGIERVAAATFTLWLGPVMLVAQGVGK